MTSQTLEYGFTTRRDPRRLIIRSVAATVLLLTCGWLLTAAYRWHYYAEANEVQAVLEAAAPTSRVDLGGFDDGPFEWKLVEAHIRVDGSPTRTILLHIPEARHLRTGRHVRIDRIGHYHFTLITQEGHWLTGLDFGAAGPFPNLLPFKPTGVSDFVSHYDEFMTFLDNLPPTGHFPSTEGRPYPFEIKDHPNYPAHRVILIRKPH